MHFQGLDVELHTGDIRNKNDVAGALEAVDGVVHHGTTSVIDSQQEPELDFDINARGTLNMLLACSRSRR